jgi:hypothetical protein
MTGNSGVMALSSDEKPIGSDLAKVDAYQLTDEDYDEIPELTDEMMARADVYVDGRLVRRGLMTPTQESTPTAKHVGGRTRKAG